jgi:phosphatidylglycerol lysyltransferase
MRLMDLGLNVLKLGEDARVDLSGLPQHELAPLWNRLGGFLFRHGEHFYNFQGLRRYKEKSGPEWRPRYLASPGWLALPQVLSDLSVLISGGIGGLVGK